MFTEKHNKIDALRAGEDNEVQTLKDQLELATCPKSINSASQAVLNIPELDSMIFSECILLC
jgi:hypothetical protein